MRSLSFLARYSAAKFRQVATLRGLLCLGMGLDMVAILNPQHDVLCGGMSHHVRCSKSPKYCQSQEVEVARPLGWNA